MWLGFVDIIEKQTPHLETWNKWTSTEGIKLPTMNYHQVVFTNQVLDSHHDRLRQEHRWLRDYPHHQRDLGHRVDPKCRGDRVHPKKAEKTEQHCCYWTACQSHLPRKNRVGSFWFEERMNWIGHKMVKYCHWCHPHPPLTHLGWSTSHSFGMFSVSGEPSFIL